MIRHRGHPLDEASAKKSAHGHEHEADGAVSADIGANVLGQRAADHVGIYGIENDYGIVTHAQCGRRIDPISIPIALAQRPIDFGCVFAALAADEDFATREFAQIGGIFECAAIAGFFRRFAAGIRGREEDRIESGEILFFAHPLHQDAADHASPANESNA